MLIPRRSFLQACGAAGITGALGWTGCIAAPDEGETLPAWKPGELDLHFIYTGCGENLFYRLPDGTAILNDTGDFYRPEALASVPLLPSADRLGGDWVSRYIARVYPERTIDYAIFSHWHSDHIGHADFGTPETPKAAFRYRTTPDGRKINGFLCVAEDFAFRRYFDPQFPHCGQHYTKPDTTMRLLNPWVEAQRKKGLVVEPFKVGALNQIRLQRDPAKYRDLFSIRNICANGIVWNGRDGVRDCASEYRAKTGRKRVDPNQLSMGFVIRYGKFGYFTGGDLQHTVFDKPLGINYEELAAKAAGPVSLCKMNHHGCTNAMSAAFAQAIRAQVYTACMWCPQQAHPLSLGRIGNTPAADGSRPLLVPNLVTGVQWDGQDANGYTVERRGAMHVVVKVAPGGDTYRVYLLDANDESMRVLAKFDKRA